MRVLKMSAAVTAAALASFAFATASASAATKVRVAPDANSQSTTFAGYAIGAANGGAVTHAFAAFKVPTITCGSTESSGVLPMAEIFNSRGSAYAAGGVFVVCDNGKLVIQNYISVNNYSPATVSFTPAAGDKMTVAVEQSSAGAKVIVSDRTQGRAQTFARYGSSFAGSDDTSNIGDSTVSINGVTVPNPAVGAISFTRALTNGVAIGMLPHTAYDEATAVTGGSVRIWASQLNTAGNWFRTTLMHAA
jgi:hypothetical protein